MTWDIELELLHFHGHTLGLLGSTGGVLVVIIGLGLVHRAEPSFNTGRDWGSGGFLGEGCLEVDILALVGFMAVLGPAMGLLDSLESFWSMLLASMLLTAMLLAAIICCGTILACYLGALVAAGCSSVNDSLKDSSDLTSLKFSKKSKFNFL